MAFKDIFRIFRRKKKKTEDGAEQPAKKAERIDPNAWPEAESAGGADDPNAWPEPDAAEDAGGAETWPDEGAAASEGGEVWPEEAWPDAGSAPADGSDAWSETGDGGSGGEAAAWPPEEGKPAEAPADGPEEDTGKKGKKTKKAKKEKKPKKKKKKKGEEGDEADEAAGGGKKKPPLLLILIPAVIVVSAAAVLLILKPWAPKDPKPDEDTEQVEPPAEAENPQEEGGGEEPDPPETPPPTRPAAPEPMDTAGAMDHFATLSPGSLGLEGESMSEYNYYATGRTVTVDGIKCREIMVYSVSASAGTNDVEGRYLLSMDGSKLFRDTGGGAITELSPSVIGLGS